MAKISVIIPCYNESGMIAETIRRVRKAVLDPEIIVVDDGSKDGTYRIAKRSGAIAVRLEKNLGKGGAFRSGIGLARGGIIVQIDGDCQFLPEDIMKMVEPITKGRADITLASRFAQGAFIEEGAMSFRNRMANHIASLMTSIASGQRVTDAQAGLKAFRAGCLRQINFRENTFAYEPEIIIMAAKKGFRMMDVPIVYEKRRKGQSNIALLKDAYYISKTILKLLLAG